MPAHTERLSSVLLTSNVIRCKKQEVAWTPVETPNYLKIGQNENAGMFKPNIYSYLRGFLSMQTCWKICCRKDGGLSCTTCWTLNRVFKYSMNRLIKFTKCSACLIFPGTASSKISSGKTGLDNTTSVSLAALASRNPWTSLLYSSLNLPASLSLILQQNQKQKLMSNKIWRKTIVEGCQVSDPISWGFSTSNNTSQ